MTATASRAVTDTTGAAAFTPLTVTIALDEPILGNMATAIHLDGPLAWCAHLEALERGHVLPRPHDDQPPADFDLGLATWTAPAPDTLPAAARTQNGDAWGWATSGAYPDPTGHLAVMQRRTPPERAMREYCTDNRQHLAAGPHRARNITRPGAWIKPITWHILGDRQRVTELLGKLTHIGAGTRHGYGRVAGVDIHTSGDREQWRQRSWPDLHAHTTGGIRAPYHHHTRQTTLRPAPRPPEC